jgi:pyruvate/2-oxoglutarate dehydrogenase complex dihydrolipoamide acyltransferase (E2) component
MTSMVDLGQQAGRTRLLVPDLGLEGRAVTVSLWLVPPGGAVLAGDRVVELLAGGATIDLEAPVSGRLVAHLVDEDEQAAAGTALAEFEAPR